MCFKISVPSVPVSLGQYLGTLYTLLTKDRNVGSLPPRFATKQNTESHQANYSKLHVSSIKNYIMLNIWGNEY